MVDRSLLKRNLRLAPSQPATALWRAIEIDHLIRSGALPREGYGLDLGCGDGRVTELLTETAGVDWRLVGVDPDPHEVALARACGLYTAVEEAEGSAMAFPGGSFDFVFSNSVLEHIESLEPTLDEVARVLKPGGHFVFTVPSEFFPENLGQPRLLGRLATGQRDASGYRAAIDRRVAHRRYLTRAEWQAALGAAGLTFVEASLYMSPAETRRWAAISNATAGLLVRLTGKGGSPIDVQRKLGLRRVSPPLWLRGGGRAVGELGALRIRGEDADDRGSCLLVVARQVGGDA